MWHIAYLTTGENNKIHATKLFNADMSVAILILMFLL